MLLELLVQCNKMFLRIILTRMVKTSLEKLFHLFTAVCPETSQLNVRQTISDKVPKKRKHKDQYLGGLKATIIHLLSILHVSVLLTMSLSSASVILLLA